MRQVGANKKGQKLPGDKKKENKVMSKRIELRVTPLSRADLFTVIKPGDVKVGDIYQGKKGRGHKWYQNTTGQACVESDRTYYRPRPSAMNALGITMPKFGERLDGSVKKPEPDIHAAAEQEEREEQLAAATAEDRLAIFTKTETWFVNRAALKSLIEELGLDLS